MALIKCPECGKEISDKAIQCINCGFPLNRYDTNNEKNNNESCVYIINGHKFQIDEGFANDIKTLVKNKDAVKLHKVSCNISQMTKMTNEEASDFLISFIKNNFVAPEKYRNYNTPVQIVQCPKCGSTNIATGQRGYSLWTGFLGSNKTVNRCSNCGYSWQPKK